MYVFLPFQKVYVTRHPVRSRGQGAVATLDERCAVCRDSAVFYPCGHGCPQALGSHCPVARLEFEVEVARLNGDATDSIVGARSCKPR